MMATLGGYLFTLIASRPLGLQGTHGGPGAARAGQRELEPQDTWRPRSCPGLAAGARAAGHVAALELPWVVRFMLRLITRESV
jgi:hypothetical protein